jgi:hypothetical protein
MIPKTIHYCWFGPAPKDELTLKCLESWQKFLPDYTFKEWNDTILQTVDNLYVKQAYAAKKWAFVADYFRLYALYHEGGIYFDTDVEVKKSFNDFLDLDFFIGSEIFHGHKGLGTAVIGATKHSHIVEALLHEYDNLSFIKPNGKLNAIPNTTRLIAPLKALGFQDIYTEDAPLCLDEKNKLYSPYHFSVESKDSYAVHHFAASWLDEFKVKTKCSLPLPHATLKLLKIHHCKGNTPYSPKGKVLFSTSQQKKSFYLLTLEKTPPLH